jgi:membrane-bound lytic murein transglycosylase D
VNRAAGIGAAITALALLALGGCTAPVRQTPPPPAPAATLPPPAQPPVAAVPALASPPVAPVSPWTRLRARFALDDCGYDTGVMHWARRYTANPAHFAATLEDAMPFLLLVTDQIEERGIAGEFAFLPYIESHYRPLPSHGNRPAGMWQFMPATARSAGLLINAGYDGRLDALASTRAALDLIAHYHDEFGDWRIADLAYNAGEYRLRHALAAQPAARPRSATELARLRLSRTTHEHLDKLLAIACIVAEPARFGVMLPDAAAGDVLQPVEVEGEMELAVVARLAGIDPDRLHRINAGYRGSEISDPPLSLLLPVDRVEQFRSAVALLPDEAWTTSRARAETGAGSGSP